jgi:hypothetical protein
MTENTQLTSASGYDVKRMIFSEPQSGSIPNSKPLITYKRIVISTKNEDGSVGDLIFPTSRLFSFGVSENLDMNTKKVNGYVMPLCLWNRDGATQEESDWVETFNHAIEACKEHLISNREAIKQWDLTKNDLKKLNPLYYKRIEGKIVEGSGPTLYAKLIVSKKQEKIVTQFFDTEGNSVNPLDLMGKYCYVNGAVKFESIFIGSKITLQIKLYEAEVKMMDTGMKRLLSRPESQPRVLNTSSNPLMSSENKEDDSDGENQGSGSIAGSDDETESKEPVKKVVKRRIKKVVRKPKEDEE